MRDTLILIASCLRFSLILHSVRWLVVTLTANGRKSRLAILLSGGFDPNSIRRVTGRELKPKYLPIHGVFGEALIVNVNDHIGWRTFLQSYFDLTPLVLAAAFARSRDGHRATYVDVGANVGTTSIPIAKTGTSVIGIEASPRAIQELSKNVTINSPLPYTIVNLAITNKVAAENGAYCRLHSPVGNLGAASLVENWNPSLSGMREEMARLSTLDSVVRFFNIDDIVLVKIDVEGLEFQVLEGFAETLEDQSPPVVFEWRPDVALNAGIQLRDIREAFPSHYECYGVRKSVTKSRHGIIVSLGLTNFDPNGEYENVIAISQKSSARNPAASQFEGSRALQFTIAPS